MRRLIPLFVVLATLLNAPDTIAAYPDKAVRLVVPFPPGGTSDSVARALARGLTQRLGQTVVVENRAGAGTVIGTQQVARSAPDGYTLLWASTPFGINPGLFQSLPYDTQRDFVAVADLYRVPLVLIVHKHFAAHTLQELIGLAKRQPAQLSYGTSGPGGSPHLAMALLAHATDTALVHVPYKGSAPALADFLGQHVTMLMDTIFLSLPHIRSGEAVALVQTGRTRSALLPDVPTVVESGFADDEVVSWAMIAAPAGTPPDVVQILNRAINATLQDPAFYTPFTAQGAEMTGGTPEEASRRLDREIKKWRMAVQISGARTP